MLVTNNVIQNRKKLNKKCLPKPFVITAMLKTAVAHSILCNFHIASLLRVAAPRIRQLFGFVYSPP